MDRRTTGLCLLVGVFGTCNCRAVEAPANSKEEMERARQRLPLDALAGPHRAAAREVLDHAVLYRRGSVEVFPCEPRLLDWLIEHPVTVAQLWRQLGIAVCPVETAADGFVCRHEDRAVIRFHTVFRGEQLRIVYCVAEVRRPLSRTPLVVQFVLVHRLRFSRQPNGQYYAIQQLEGFAAADGPTLQAVMKLGRAAWGTGLDRGLGELSVYFAAICRVLQHRPQWGLATLARLSDRVTQSEVAELERLLRELPHPATDLLPAGFAELLSATESGKR